MTEEKQGQRPSGTSEEGNVLIHTSHFVSATIQSPIQLNRRKDNKRHTQGTLTCWLQKCP